MTYILGISAYYHDSAACLVKDGEIIAAAQEERFTRKKNAAAFPIKAINYCLKEANITAQELDYIGFYEKPLIKFERLITTYLATAPRGFISFAKALPSWLKQKLWLPGQIRKELKVKNTPIIFPEHHEAHAAAAFFPAPYQAAAVLTIDGVGEWATASISLGKSNKITMLKEMAFPHSLGLLYSAFTYYLGFRVNSGEYKVMGLAPYGKPKYVSKILNNLLDLKPDGSFRLNMQYFNYLTGLTMTSRHFHDLFGGPPRKRETELTQRHKDIARSIQEVTEEIVLRMAKHALKLTGNKNLCLAGGVALNCVANARLREETSFRKIWAQPAAGDSGAALGTALFIWHQYLGKKRKTTGQDIQKASLLGPAYSNQEIKSFLVKNNIPYTYFPEHQKLAKKIAELIAQQKVIGLLQGRMEFGPRALGCRSILADPRSPEMRNILNKKIKFRESFRPFAPAVLAEKASKLFNTELPDPYMLFTVQVKKSGLKLPSVTHLDNSARLQTVSKKDNPYFHLILEEFEKLTGCPVLINTSFNVRGEPIVCTPEDAYNCFQKSGIDHLVLENYLINKD